MADPIEIRLNADASGVIREAKKAGESFEDLGDSLDDVVKDADRAGDAIGDDIKAGAKEAEAATERLERSFNDLAQAAQRETKKAGDATSANIRQGSSNAKEAMNEVKAEALANASETFSSFDGSASSFVDGIQGTFGGLIAGLGQVNPALIPVAAAAAVTIGVIAGAITGAEQKSDEFKAKVSELTAEFIESGTIGGRAFDDMVSSIKDLATETDDSKTNLQDLRDYADTLGVSFEDVVHAYEQGGSALDDLIRKTDSLADKTADTDPFEQPTQGALDYIGKLRDIEEQFQDQRDAIDEATEAQALYLSSGVTEMEAKAGLISQINDAYDEAAGATEDFLDAESGVFDVAAYIDSMQKREEALRNYQDTLATSGLSDQAMAFLNEQGAEAAASMLAGYQSAAPAQRAELDRIWSEAARQNSGTYADQLGKSLGTKTVTGPTVVVNTSAAEAEISKLTNKKATKVIELAFRDQYGRNLQ